MTSSGCYVALAVQALCLAAASNQQVSVGDVVVNFIGKSGKMEFCPTGMCHEKRIRVTMARLEEVTSTGEETRNKVLSFASQDFDWSTPEEVEFEGNTGIKVAFSAQVRVGSNSPQADIAQFNMTSFFFNDTAMVPYGNNTLEVPANSLKFAINVAGWPWNAGSTSNQLKFGIKVETKSPDGDSASQETEGSSKKVHVPGFEIDIPSVAIADEMEVEATSSMTTMGNGNAVELAWIFPNFQSALFYDPVISSDSDSLESSSSFSAFSSVGARFLCWTAALLVLGIQSV